VKLKFITHFCHPLIERHFQNTSQIWRQFCTHTALCTSVKEGKDVSICYRQLFYAVSYLAFSTPGKTSVHWSSYDVC